MVRLNCYIQRTSYNIIIHISLLSWVSSLRHCLHAGAVFVLRISLFSLTIMRDLNYSFLLTLYNFELIKTCLSNVAKSVFQLSLSNGTCVLMILIDEWLSSDSCK